jgi:hypothetical protein
MLWRCRTNETNLHLLINYQHYIKTSRSSGINVYRTCLRTNKTNPSPMDQAVRHLINESSVVVVDVVQELVGFRGALAVQLGARPASGSCDATILQKIPVTQ